MSQDELRKGVSTPGGAMDGVSDARSGSGADTALQAMLKKRQMNATSDEVCPPRQPDPVAPTGK